MSNVNFMEYLTKNLTVSNVLSLMRIVTIVPFVMAVLSDDYITAVSILVISALTDFLDGAIARKFGQITDLGKMLDPTADKLTLMAVMICVGIKFPEVFPFMIILIVKEVIMLAAGAVMIALGCAPPAAKWYGKVATGMFYASIVTIIGTKAFCNYSNDILNSTLMCVTATTMFYAVFRYGQIFLESIKNRKDNIIIKR